jgi:ABC-2 type transport system ATP-binding protein
VCFKTDQALPPALSERARVQGRTVMIPVDNAAQIEQLLTDLRLAGIHAEGIEMVRPSLEDVFLQLMTQTKRVDR